MGISSKFICGDCLDVMSSMPENSVDLIVTSPPYANSRKDVYGGVAPELFVEWMLPRAEQMLRVLKPDGTFVLNIKEKAVNGERHTYVLELIIAMRKLGWRWTEEFIWHKKNCFPGKWPTRFRDAWERCLQFNKSSKFHMDQDAVKVPIGDWSKSRLQSLGTNDTKRHNSKVQSGFGKKVANWVGKETVYPTNVLHMATECGNKKHCATFPVDLPLWFIKLFSRPEGVVLDPFSGSGTTGVAAKMMGRSYIGIDTMNDYCVLGRKRWLETYVLK